MTEQEKRNEYNAQHFDLYDPDCCAEFTFEDGAFQYWVEHAETRRGQKRTSHSAYTVIDKVARFFREYETLTAESVKEYIDRRLDNGAEPTSINGVLMSLKAYIRFLAEKYRAPHLREFPIRTVKVQKKQFVENVISRADYDFLVAETKKDTKHPNVYLGIRIMGTTGLRKSELLQVKVEHIKAGYVDVIGKGRKQRRIYFPKNARAEIMEYLNEIGVDSGYVLRNWRPNKPTGFTGNERGGGSFKEMRQFISLFDKQLEAAGKRYGIAPELMHAHGFRHFFAKEFLKNRLDISLLADLLGHSSLEVTRIYLKMTSREQADIVDDVVTW